MSKILNSNDISVSRDLLERVNPVFNTAKMTLQMLSSTGNKDAQALAEKLNYSYDNTVSWFANENKGEEWTGAGEGLMSSAICVESRFNTMAALAETSGCHTVIDLPCGYTPHAVEYARKGIRFVGLDLPAVISKVEPAILSLTEHKDLIRFAAVDATNYDSLEKALSGIDEPVCITTEGLLMYFTDSELGQVCTNIRNILTRYGGCWIAADPEGACQTIRTLQVICGDRFQEVLTASVEKTQTKEDTLMTANSLVIDPFTPPGEGIKSAMDFLAAYGLKAERKIILDHMPEVKSLNRLSPEQADAIREMLGDFAYWSITVDEPENGQFSSSTVVETETDVFSAVFEDGCLSLKLKGRIDTLNAPLLLGFYEKVSAEHKIKSVKADCSQLRYISSAGLRVLLVMHKGSERGLAVSGVNTLVAEILDQTGFSGIFCIMES